jgi:hypothetical protein
MRQIGSKYLSFRAISWGFSSRFFTQYSSIIDQNRPGLNRERFIGSPFTASDKGVCASSRTASSSIFREVPMHSRGLRLRRTGDALALTRTTVLASVQRGAVGALNSRFQWPSTSGMPSLHIPCRTLPGRRPRRARGQDGSLLSCMPLSFTTSRRFIPTLSALKACGRRASDGCAGFKLLNEVVHEQAPSMK